MRNAVISLVLIAVLILAAITLYGIEGKTTRQNELDANLSSAMKSSLEVLTIDESYTIDKENEEHLIADFLQNFLVRMNSKSAYKIEVLAVDNEKGLLSAKAIETYPTLFGESSVEATRTVIVDKYENTNDDYYKVTFYQEYSNGKYISPVKQIHVYGGSSLEDLVPTEPARNGYTFNGWRLTGFNSLDGLYTDLSKIVVTDNLNFVAEWSKDADNVCTVTLYKDNQVHQILKVNKGEKLGTHKAAPVKEGYKFKGWSSKNKEYLSDSNLSNETISRHTRYRAVYEEE